MGVGHMTNEGTRGAGASAAAGALADLDYQRDLGNGLLLRWSTQEDTDQLVTMFANVMRSRDDAPPDHFHGCLVRDMMSGRHPYLTSSDFAVVEDTTTEQIVAATCLFANAVTYEHIPLMMGRAAIVGTEIAYRDRGLQRAIFGLIHARSAARGHLLQGITGINYFYRQFGYEHAIDLEASRHVYFAALPSLKTAASVPITLRPALETDIPLLVSLAAHEQACWQIATVLDAQAWRWMLFESDRALGTSGTAYMITTAEGVTIGYMLLDRRGKGGFAGDSVGIWGMAVNKGISLVEIAPHALGALRDLVAAFPSPQENVSGPARFRLEMGPGHALFAALGPELAPLNGNHYAWWIRIPDVPAFIRHIAQVLEQRLERSILTGYTGEMTIDFYRSGLRLVFEQGKLVRAEAWRKPLWGPEQTRFPPLVFTKLLLGYRSYTELSYAFEDVWADHADRILLATLFPPQSSYMLPLF